MLAIFSKKQKKAENKKRTNVEEIAEEFWKNKIDERPCIYLHELFYLLQKAKEQTEPFRMGEFFIKIRKIDNYSIMNEDFNYEVSVLVEGEPLILATSDYQEEIPEIKDQTELEMLLPDLAVHSLKKKVITTFSVNTIIWLGQILRTKKEVVGFEETLPFTNKHNGKPILMWMLNERIPAMDLFVEEMNKLKQQILEIEKEKKYQEEFEQNKKLNEEKEKRDRYYEKARNVF